MGAFVYTFLIGFVFWGGSILQASDILNQFDEEPNPEAFYQPSSRSSSSSSRAKDEFFKSSPPHRMLPEALTQTNLFSAPSKGVKSLHIPVCPRCAEERMRPDLFALSKKESKPSSFPPSEKKVRKATKEKFPEKPGKKLGRPPSKKK